MSSRLTCITTQHVLALLRDRQWHTLGSIAQELGVHISAEMAGRWLDHHRAGMRKHRSNKQLRETGQGYGERMQSRKQEVLAVKIATARMIIVQKRLAGMTYDPRDGILLERKGSGKKASFRLGSWFCANCGDSVRGKLPVFPLCKVCRQAGLTLTAPEEQSEDGSGN